MRGEVYITKSIEPSSCTHLSTAFSKLSIFRTSIAPMPMTFAPFRAVAMFCAIFSVFSTFRPMIHAFAPRWTRALTWAEQIVPAPPVQNTTFPSRFRRLVLVLFMRRGGGTKYSFSPY